MRMARCRRSKTLESRGVCLIGALATRAGLRAAGWNLYESLKTAKLAILLASVRETFTIEGYFL